MQGEIFTAGPVAPRRRKATIQERFDAFCARHPDVPALFERFALEVKAAGRRSYGARSIVERIRWEYATSSAGGEDFKINDNYISRFARQLMERRPEFVGFFELRKLRSA